MTYPNAYKGVKKIYLSRIIGLIGTAVMLLSSVAAILLNMASADSGASVSLNLRSVLTLLTFLCGAAISVVCFILNLIGVIQAKADEPVFLKALIFMILSFALSTSAAIFTNYPIARNALSAVGTAASIATIYFIILGIRLLAKKLDRPDVDHKGVVTFRLLIISSLLMIVSDILSILDAMIPNPVIAPITRFVIPVAGIVSVVGSIVCLVFLKRAVRMLEA